MNGPLTAASRRALRRGTQRLGAMALTVAAALATAWSPPALAQAYPDADVYGPLDDYGLIGQDVFADDPYYESGDWFSDPELEWEYYYDEPYYEDVYDEDDYYDDDSDDYDYDYDSDYELYDDDDVNYGYYYDESEDDWEYGYYDDDDVLYDYYDSDWYDDDDDDDVYDDDDDLYDDDE